MKWHAIVLTSILCSGCSGYSTYIECKADQESKGVSVLTGHALCNKKVKDGDIECDSQYCQGGYDDIS